MQIEFLKDCKGANKFGTCNGCGDSTDTQPKMRRLRFEAVSVCLCEECFKNVAEQIIREVEQNG